MTAVLEASNSSCLLQTFFCGLTIAFLENCHLFLDYQQLHGIHYIANCKQANKREIADTATVSTQTDPNFFFGQFRTRRLVLLLLPRLELVIFIFLGL